MVLQKIIKLDGIEVLSKEFSIFKVIVPKKDKLVTIEDFAKLKIIPSTITQILIKEKDDSFDIYCYADHHSDFISLEERTGYKVKSI